MKMMKKPNTTSRRKRTLTTIREQTQCRFCRDGKTYIDGPCDFTATKEQFEISNRGTGKGLFFAIVDTEPEGAEGFWNAERGATHAHSHHYP